jgi:hypothetical protein
MSRWMMWPLCNSYKPQQHWYKMLAASATGNFTPFFKVISKRLVCVGGELLLRWIPWWGIRYVDPRSGLATWWYARYPICTKFLSPSLLCPTAPHELSFAICSIGFSLSRSRGLNFDAGTNPHARKIPFPMNARIRSRWSRVASRRSCSPLGKLLHSKYWDSCQLRMI